MLYSLSTYNSGRFGHLTYPWDYYDVEETKCKVCGRMVRNIRLKHWPPKFTLEGGKRYPDLLGVVTPFEDKCGMIISDKAYQAFKMEGISGFWAEPVAISNSLKNTQSEATVKMPDYYYCFVTGRISLDYHAMHYRKKNECPECGQYIWSRQKIGESVLDYSTWDQSDICKLTDYPNVFICGQRVLDVIKYYNLKGFSKASEKDIFLPLKYQKIC